MANLIKPQLAGLVFLVHENELEINYERFIDRLHKIDSKVFNIKETDGPLINGLIVITIEIAIDYRDIPKPNFPTLKDVIEYIQSYIGARGRRTWHEH